MPQWDVHVITGALKLFFRELREPVFTADIFQKFLDAFSMFFQMYVCTRESVKLGQRSMSASNESSTIRLEILVIFFTQLDGGCRTGGGISARTSR